MIVHKCDVCGDEIRSWLTITVGVGSCDPRASIEGLKVYAKSIEVCRTCYTSNDFFRQGSAHRKERSYDAEY